MSYSNLSIEGKLAASQPALANAANNPSILALLTAYGYDAARIAIGQAFYDAAQAAHVAQKQEYGEQYAASQAFETAWKTANETYMQLVKVARVAFSTGSCAHYLPLNSKTPGAVSIPANVGLDGCPKP